MAKSSGVEDGGPVADHLHEGLRRNLCHHNFSISNFIRSEPRPRGMKDAKAQEIHNIRTV